MVHGRCPRPLLILAVVASACFLASAGGCYTSIFSFGDSYVDTGNAFFCDMGHNVTRHLPYGMTYFGHYAGRCSDGRLIVDFIAQAMELPLLRPYLAGGSAEDFRSGANFAVAAATALDAEFFQARGIDPPGILYSMESQMTWFRQLIDLLKSSSNSSSEEVLSKSLIIFGLFGGNDEEFLLLKTKDLNETRSYLPLIVARTSSAIIELIELGATTIVVPGNLPLGCLPLFLNMFDREREEDYDAETGCLNSVNALAEYENKMRQLELERIRKLYPHVLISYADYYNAAMRIIRNPESFGFKPPVTSACCGLPGPYNFDFKVRCGDEMTTLFSDPSSSVIWDGIHLTESAYRLISEDILTGGYANPSFTEACPNISNSVADFRSSSLMTI